MKSTSPPPLGDGSVVRLTEVPSRTVHLGGGALIASHTLPVGCASSPSTDPLGWASAAGAPTWSSVTPRSRAPTSRPISSWSSSSVSKPRSPPHASARLAKISQSARLMPSRPRIARSRWPRPSQVETCPSFSRKALAGRNASAYRSSEPSSSDCTTLTGTLSSARRTRSASGTSRSGSTPIRNSTSTSRSAQARRMAIVSRPGSRFISGPQARFDVVHLVHRASAREQATGARPRAARRDRSLVG